MTPRVEAIISLDAITHNFNVIRSHVKADTQIMPMVKANAYGHGLIEVAHHLQEADAFGVATLVEAMRLRDAGIKKNIFVMCGFRSSDEIPLFAEFNLTAVMHHLDQLNWLIQSPPATPISLWLKVDTGMHRLGIAVEDFEAVYESLSQLTSVKQPFGIMSHFANADADPDFTRQQLEQFQRLTAGITNPKSIANSAGIVAFHEAQYQLVRPGIMLYGVSPFADKTGAQLGLKPAMELWSRLVSYKKVRQGEPVGYGCTWRSKRDTIIGIVTVGYGDGYPRHACNRTPVLVNEQPAAVVGRVSMDLMAVDLSTVKRPAIGDKVLLWGEQLPVEHIATAADTIAYELFCQLTERVQRSLVV